MSSILFTFHNQNLFLTQYTKKSIIPFFNGSASFDVKSLGCFYSYGIEIIRDNIITAYIKNPSLPIIYLGTYEHMFIEKIKQKIPQKYCAINLSYLNDKEEIIFSDKINENIQQKIIDNCEEKQISIISSSVSIQNYTDDIIDKYKELFFNYLLRLENIANTISKTVLMVNVEHQLFNNEELIRIHKAIKNIKDLGHICIFMYHSYSEIRDENIHIFGEDNLYENYFISTMGYGNQTLINTKDKKIYGCLPIQLKNFFNDTNLASYLKNDNFYHKKHKISIISEASLSFRNGINIIDRLKAQ